MSQKDFHILSVRLCYLCLHVHMTDHSYAVYKFDVLFIISVFIFLIIVTF